MKSPVTYYFQIFIDIICSVWVSCAEVPSANSIGSKAFCKNIMYIKNNKGTKVESWRTEALIFSYCVLSWNSSYEEGPYHIETSLLI